MTEATSSPTLSAEYRTACGHGAEGVGLAAYEFAGRRLASGRCGPMGAAWLINSLRSYRHLCELSARDPQPHWVAQIEAAIALGEPAKTGEQ